MSGYILCFLRASVCSHGRMRFGLLLVPRVSSVLHRYILYLLFRTSRKNRLEPSRHIFGHMCRSGSPGIFAKYSGRLFVTVGIISAVTPLILSNSARNPPYLDIFSISFFLILVSTGQEISTMKAFLFATSFKIISGQFAPTGLVVDITWS